MSPFFLPLEPTQLSERIWECTRNLHWVRAMNSLLLHPVLMYLVYKKKKMFLQEPVVIFMLSYSSRREIEPILEETIREFKYRNAEASGGMGVAYCACTLFLTTEGRKRRILNLPLTRKFERLFCSYMNVSLLGFDLLPGRVCHLYSITALYYSSSCQMCTSYKIPHKNTPSR